LQQSNLARAYFTGMIYSDFFLENSKDLIVLAQHVHRLLLQVTYHNAEFSIDTVQKGLTLQN